MSDNLSSKDLNAQIKEMEEKKRLAKLANNKVTFIQPDGDNDIVSFDQWWMIASKKRTFRPYMKEVIFADFKGRGLKARETIARFDEALRKFGINI